MWAVCIVFALIDMPLPAPIAERLQNEMPRFLRMLASYAAVARANGERAAALPTPETIQRNYAEIVKGKK